MQNQVRYVRFPSRRSFLRTVAGAAAAVAGAADSPTEAAAAPDNAEP